MSARTKLIIAFAAVYTIWGSTYLAIRLSVETIPPFLMAGARFLLAGALMTGLARARGAQMPTWRQWRSTLIVGFLLLVGGNGALTWAEQEVPSGLASLLVATVPLWMVLLDWARPAGLRPNSRVFAGLALGMVGLAVLVGPELSAGLAPGSGPGPTATGIAAILFGSFSWAAGSIYSRGAEMPKAPLLGVGLEMLNAGVLLLLISLLSGDAASLVPADVSTRSFLAYLYLVFIGALVGYTAYIYLLGHTTAAKVSTYAYVNPVVAVFLGWLLIGEEVTLRTLAGAAIIVIAVALISLTRAPRRRPLSPAG
ncbi:MAG: EamA family transporter [Anaerolineae bacterium]|nr:EamA family transporter [Anaerolineae bacterium]